MLRNTICAALAAGVLLAAPAAFAAPQGRAMHDRAAREVAHEMRQAGFVHVRHLREGGDGYWHALADHGGTAVHVVRTPDRKVMQEGN